MGTKVLWVSASAVCMLAGSGMAVAAGAAKPAPRAAADIGYEVVYSFENSTDHVGHGTVASLAPIPNDATGSMLGTNFSGGDGAQKSGALLGGTVFKLDPSSKTVTSLHEFKQVDGTGPTTGLVRAPNGDWYGLTLGGGQYGVGKAYRISANLTSFTPLHDFGVPGSSEGRLPARGMLAVNVDGTFYGATTQGGAGGKGTVFKMDTNGTVTTLHDFLGGTADGAFPQDQPVLVNDTLYGATPCGGATSEVEAQDGCAGTVYSLKLGPAPIYKVLHKFPGGARPVGSPVVALLDMGKRLVGTTFAGGSAGFGTVYAKDPDDTTNTISILHDFEGGAATGTTNSDGASPMARLLLATDGSGNLYGTTSNGGNHTLVFPKGDGTIFRIDMHGVYTSLYAFGAPRPVGADAAHPVAALVQGAGGKIYGTADNGGTDLVGAIFRFQPGSAMANTARRQRRRSGRTLGPAAAHRRARATRSVRARVTVVGLALAALAGGACAQPNADLLEASKAWHLVVGDFDGDSHDDILVGGHDPDDRIWYWTPIGYQPGPQTFPMSDRHACAAADVDGDGTLDLFCAIGGGQGNDTASKRGGLSIPNCQVSKKNELWLQKQSGVFTKAVNFGAEDFCTARGRRPVFLDLDNNGFPDLYVSTDTADGTGDEYNHNRMFLNFGGVFHEVQTIATGEKGWACVAKGHIQNRVEVSPVEDLLVCQGGSDSHIYLNKYDTIQDFDELLPTETKAIGHWIDAHLVDMNGDGLDDLVDLTKDGVLEIWLNTGTRPFFANVPTFYQQVSFPELNVFADTLTVGHFNGDLQKMDVYVVRYGQCQQAANPPDDLPDMLFKQSSAAGQLTWAPITLVQPNFRGCGRLSDTVDHAKVLLSNGTEQDMGPSYILDFSQ